MGISTADIIAIFKLKAVYMACMEKIQWELVAVPVQPPTFLFESHKMQHVLSAIHNRLMYLSAVHMWDREHKYPFVTKKAPMPHQAIVNDGHDYDVMDSNDGEEISCQLSFTPANAQSRPLLSGTSKNKKHIQVHYQNLIRAKKTQRSMPKN